MTTDPLKIMLVVLVIAAIWAVVELALTFRKTRTTLDGVNKAVDDISHSANELIDQAMPVIDKADGLVDELDPVVRSVPGLIGSTSTMLDEGTASFTKLNKILGDVSSATHGVAGVGESATRIMNTATSAAVGVVSKVASLGGITIPEGQQLIGKAPAKPEKEPTKAKKEPAALASSASDEAPEKAAHARKGGYVTYSPASTSDHASSDGKE